MSRKTLTLQIRIDEKERAYYAAMAGLSKLSVSEWARKRLKQPDNIELKPVYITNCNDITSMETRSGGEECTDSTDIVGTIVNTNTDIGTIGQCGDTTIVSKNNDTLDKRIDSTKQFVSLLKEKKPGPIRKVQVMDEVIDTEVEIVDVDYDPI